MRVGVVDWGIGGVYLLHALRRRSRLDLHYLSDSGAPPWGTLPPARLAARLDRALRWLAGREVQAVVVACNAASTVLDAIDPPLPVLGIIRPGLEELLGMEPGLLGLIGGDRTVASAAWSTPLRAAGWSLRERSGQILSAHVEAGRLRGPQVRAAMQELLEELGDIPRLVLACTHYPALGPLFTELRPELELIDPARALEDTAIQRFGRTGGGRLLVHTTGDPQRTRRAAWLAYGCRLGRISRLPPTTLSPPASTTTARSDGAARSPRAEGAG